jgi:hypothetical protein
MENKDRFANIPEESANSLVQKLAELLDEACHQIWHAVHDPESFNRETAWKAHNEIKRAAHEAVEGAFGKNDARAVQDFSHIPINSK